MTVGVSFGTLFLRNNTIRSRVLRSIFVLVTLGDVGGNQLSPPECVSTLFKLRIPSYIDFKGEHFTVEVII